MMTWGKMGHRVALDVALGLNYLHSRCPACKTPSCLLFELSQSQQKAALPCHHAASAPGALLLCTACR